MATVGGNLLQRTRCPYFSQRGACLQQARTWFRMWRAFRRESSGGLIRRKQVVRRDPRLGFGGGADGIGCRGRGLRSGLERGAFRCSISTGCPPRRRRRETNLAAGELITGIHVSNASRFAARSTYLKVRDRASFEFAVVSVAAVLRVENGMIVEAKLAAAGSRRCRGGLRAARRHSSAAHRIRKPSLPPAIWPSRTPGRSPTTASRSELLRMPSSAPCKPLEAGHEHRFRSSLRAALKVTGSAVFEAEVPAAGLLHAALVEAPISCGDVLSVDATHAARCRLRRDGSPRGSGSAAALSANRLDPGARHSLCRPARCAHCRKHIARGEVGGTRGQDRHAGTTGSDGAGASARPVISAGHGRTLPARADAGTPPRHWPKPTSSSAISTRLPSTTIIQWNACGGVLVGGRQGRCFTPRRRPSSARGR